MEWGDEWKTLRAIQFAKKKKKRGQYTSKTIKHLFVVDVLIICYWAAMVSMYLPRLMPEGFQVLSFSGYV